MMTENEVIGGGVEVPHQARQGLEASRGQRNTGEFPPCPTEQPLAPTATTNSPCIEGEHPGVSHLGGISTTDRIAPYEGVRGPHARGQSRCTLESTDPSARPDSSASECSDSATAGSRE